MLYESSSSWTENEVRSYFQRREERALPDEHHLEEHLAKKAPRCSCHSCLSSGKDAANALNPIMGPEKFEGPKLLKILESRYVEAVDQRELLCVLARSRSPDTGREFWILYHDLLINPDHAHELKKFNRKKKTLPGRGEEKRR